MIPVNHIQNTDSYTEHRLVQGNNGYRNRQQYLCLQFWYVILTKISVITNKMNFAPRIVHECSLNGRTIEIHPQTLHRQIMFEKISNLPAE